MNVGFFGPTLYILVRGAYHGSYGNYLNFWDTACTSNVFQMATRAEVTTYRRRMITLYRHLEALLYPPCRLYFLLYSASHLNVLWGFWYYLEMNVLVFKHSLYWISIAWPRVYGRKGTPRRNNQTNNSQRPNNPN